ncbi:hypothetical protein [Acinetobacter baumannii]
MYGIARDAIAVPAFPATPPLPPNIVAAPAPKAARAVQINK